MIIHPFSRFLRRYSFLLPFLFLFVRAAAAADVKGTVANAQGGEPLGKVKITLVGTSFLATTASDGSFQISQVPPGSYVLQASAVGYRTLTVPFQIATAEETKEFQLTLTPDNFRVSEVVEVHGDVFEAKDWPAVGDLTLTSSELQQTSTVLANDPFRSLQALPGVSASGNNEFLAQFSVMGAPYDQVGIYVDDVLVPNLLHTVASFPDAPTLSLLTGNDVEDLRLMPVAYPVRYGDASDAALAIRTRTGSESGPLFHASVGLADSEFLGEGGFGHSHKGTWLIDGRKSYIGYLERLIAGSRFSQDGFYDADLKLTYNLTPTQTFSLLATGGSLAINDPKLSAMSDQNMLKTGTNDLVLTRLGWRWTPRSNLLLDAHAAFVSTRFNETNGGGLLIDSSLDREWSGGSNLSWSWHRGAILQAGYAVRQPRLDSASNFFTPGQLPTPFSFHTSDVRQDSYVQHSAQLWRDRLRFEGGFRWANLNTLRVQPITGQFSLAFQAARQTQIEAAWGRYAQLPFRGGIGAAVPIGGVTLGIADQPRSSSQYVFAIEQRLGERSRFRVEAFDRQNDQREDFYFLPSRIPIRPSVVVGRDYSRGLQFIVQRRSENRLSGWIGYTLTYAQSRFLSLPLPPPIGTIGLTTPYEPTLQDQRHTANLFGSYRLTPSLRLSAKALYGSGFQVNSLPPPVVRLGPYERLDLRADKSWLIRKYKLSLYGELLNATNHDNRRFAGEFTSLPSGQLVVFTNDGIPATPTVGLAFDF
jgi:hypothetical protein